MATEMATYVHYCSAQCRPALVESSSLRPRRPERVGWFKFSSSQYPFGQFQLGLATFSDSDEVVRVQTNPRNKRSIVSSRIRA